MPAWELDPFEFWSDPQTVERLAEQLQQELAALDTRRAWLTEYRAWLEVEVL